MAEQEQPLAFVHETVLKKRKNNEEWIIKKRQRLEGRNQRRKEYLKHAIKRPEQFVKEYRAKELDLMRMKHRVKSRKLINGNIESKLLFVIRIHGSEGMHPQSRKILNSLRLWHIFDGIFMEANEKNLKLLLAVEPFVTYGYPNLKSIKQLVYKKGRGYIDRQWIPLTDNNLIEEALGAHDIICLEDIIHEIATVGVHFKEVMRFLWPLKLNKPDVSIHLNKKAYKHGGDTGNRGDHINEFISKLN